MNNIYNIAACTATVCSNDIKYMHLLADGEDFDKIHNLAEEYYAQLSDDADYLYELAIEHHEHITNPNFALEELDDYDIQAKSSYDYPELIKNLKEIISRYINCLQTIRDVTTENDVQSFCDDKMRFWKKELNYKLEHRH